MSLDGRFIAFSSAATNTVDGDTNGWCPTSSSAIACCGGLPGSA